MVEMKENFWPQVEQKAQELGFTEVGGAQIISLNKEVEFLETWLRKNYDADMTYIRDSKEIRGNPSLFLPGAKSVLVGTLNYYQPVYVNPGTGLISRYAAGRDYHKFMKKRLRLLANFLKTNFFPESRKDDFRISVDIEPVMERTWACMANLGFIGKNGCLITGKAGSWVFIGTIFTTKNFPEKEDRNQQGFSGLSCETCTLCMDSCPNNAIVSPGIIDSRKCISYLTVENKGIIPEVYREGIGIRFFGCDICQEVCPINQKLQTEQNNPLKNPDIYDTMVHLSEVLLCKNDEKSFSRFKGSPIIRLKRDRILRNACITAGNIKDQKLLPYLTKLIESETDPLVKIHATWARDRILYD